MSEYDDPFAQIMHSSTPQATAVRDILRLQAELREARNAALEEAAAYCETHIMSTPCRGDKATHDIYVADDWSTTDERGGGRHHGHGYASAIRALKKEG